MEPGEDILARDCLYQQFLHLLAVQRHGEKIPLNVFAPQRIELGELFFRFHPFSDHAHPQPVGHHNYRLDDF